ncbi:hypothetical protein GCM10010524_15940 [Streptomyces mexicanus]
MAPGGTQVGVRKVPPGSVPAGGSRTPARGGGRHVPGGHGWGARRERQERRGRRAGGEVGTPPARRNDVADRCRTTAPAMEAASAGITAPVRPRETARGRSPRPAQRVNRADPADQTVR